MGLISRTQSRLVELAGQLRLDGINVAGRIAPGADNEPDDVAEVLWTHHVDRRVFQTRLGMP